MWKLATTFLIWAYKWLYLSSGGMLSQHLSKKTSRRILEKDIKYTE
jgi:hypothetical protein